MRKQEQNGAAAATAVLERETAADGTQALAVPEKGELATLPPRERALAELGPGELEGIDEFGMANWISFDAQRGVMCCRAQDCEYGEFQAVVVESRVVRVMKDEEGQVFCASSDRQTADSGRIGRECASCEDRGVHCHPRWWIAWQDLESGLVFAHTLSQTGSINFGRYANSLLRQGLSPGRVLTRIYVEEARRQKTGTAYRRLSFEQVGTAE